MLKINRKKVLLKFISTFIIATFMLSFMPAFAFKSDQSDMEVKIDAKRTANTWLGKAVGSYTSLEDGMSRKYENGYIYIGKSVGQAYIVMGEIYNKWSALGAQKSFLGYPTTDELPTPDKIGRFNHFQGGSIYWTKELGAHEVHGDIRTKWSSLGWEKGFLGYPTTDELTTPDGQGRYTHFQGGSIYWTKELGAHEVHGVIKEKWASLGWEKSFLGYPITDELTTSDGKGRYTNFQGGSIYWTKELGAHEVHGDIRTKWSSLGWEKSFLGYPITDELTTPDGIGRYTHFQKGSIYWYPGAGAFEVHGLIRDKWKSMGWEKSSLGYPLSDELKTSDGKGRYSIFQNGRIYYHPSYGTHYVQGKIYLYWADKGFEKSSLGYPKGDPVALVAQPGSITYLKQEFVKGTLSTLQKEIKNRVDLRGEINRRGIAIRNQGGRNTCSVFAMTFLLEYSYTGLLGNKYNNLSEEYSNHAANKAAGRTCDGDFFNYIGNGYEKYGIVLENKWPYNMNLVYNYQTEDPKMTSNLINEGTFLIRKGLKLKGRFIKPNGEPVGLTSAQFNDIITCLDKCIPVALGRGHSMCIVGYEKNSAEEGGGHFIFRNSYGTSTTDTGYLMESFKSVKSTACDAYVCEGIAP